MSVPQDDMGGGELKKDKRGGGVPDDLGRSECQRALGG